MSILTDLEAALAGACDQMHRDAVHEADDVPPRDDLRDPDARRADGARSAGW